MLVGVACLLFPLWSLQVVVAAETLASKLSIKFVCETSFGLKKVVDLVIGAVVVTEPELTAVFTTVLVLVNIVVFCVKVV